MSNFFTRKRSPAPAKQPTAKPVNSPAPSTIEIDGEQVPVLFKVMKRKSLRLNVTEQGEVEVRLPKGVPRAQLNSFLQANTQWIIERRRQFCQHQLKKQQIFLWFGQPLEIVRSNILTPIEVGDQQLLINENFTEIEPVIDKWLRAQAYQYFQQRIDFWWPQFAEGAQIDKPVLRVKKMKTRWGSLSQRGYINLNLSLMHYAPELIEMVVVHELSHSHYFNHSAAFYNLMASKLPNYRMLEKQLSAASQQAFML